MNQTKQMKKSGWINSRTFNIYCLMCAQPIAHWSLSDKLWDDGIITTDLDEDRKSIGADL